MEIITSGTLTPDQKEQIVNLWNTEYPKALSLAGVAAFDEYLAKLLDKHYLLIVKQGTVLGWLVSFLRDGERCFAMLLNSQVQGRGLGLSLLNKAKEYNEELIGWVIDTNDHLKRDGTGYKSPIGFYSKAGFEIFYDITTRKNEINGIRVKWRRQP